MNEDGQLDLVTFGAGAQGELLLGVGDGGFAVGPTPQFPLGVVDWKLADVNVDGHLDLVGVSQVGFSDGGRDIELQVALGAGDGTFAPATSTPMTALPRRLLVHDLDGDGLPDVLVGVGEELPTGDYRLVAVMHNQGDGGFVQVSGINDWPAYNGYATELEELKLGRFGPNGALGFATGDRIYAGAPDGGLDEGFLLPNSWPYTSSIVSLAVGNLNGDGRDDLVGFGYVPSSMLVYLALADGGFDVPTAYSPRAQSLARLADFNGDDDADVALCGNASSIQVSLGNGRGGFGQFASWPLDADGAYLQCTGLVAGDFNGDGKLDIAIAESSTSSVRVLLAY